MGERRRAILIGNNKFPNKVDEISLRDLRCPPNDIADLAKLLKRCAFDQVKILKNRNSYKILRATREMLAEAGSEGPVLIYYSGHGKRDMRGKLYLATYETTGASQQLAATALSYDAVMDAVRDSPATRVGVILDCCYSGIGPTRGGIEDQLNSVGATGTFVITATRHDEEAEELPEDRNGLLTKHILRGIQTFEADMDSDNKISMNDLYNYVYRQITLSKAKQRPTQNVNVTGEIIIADQASKRAVRAPVEPPPPSPPPITRAFETAGKFESHSNLVCAIAFSPGGGFLASASPDGTARLRNLTEGTAFRIDAHHGFVRAVSFNPSGNLLATAGEDHTVRVWHTANRGPYAVIRASAPVQSICFTKDGRLAVGTSDGDVRLWQLDRDYFSPRLVRHNGLPLCIRISDDGRVMASVGTDNRVRIVELAQNRTYALPVHSDEVRSIALAPNGATLVSATANGKLYLWDAASATLKLQLPAHEGFVNCVAFSPQGDRYASAGGDGKVKIWDASNGALRQTISTEAKQYCVVFGVGGQHLAAGGEDGAIRLWRLSAADRKRQTGAD